MKKVMLSLVIIASIGFTACKNQTENNTETSHSIEQVNEITATETTFGVRGNCGMCKKTIEKAANSVEGVISANWNVDLKKIEVAYEASKTDEMAIHNAIAASGYDNEKAAGSETAYNELPSCCQYDHEMQMSLELPLKNSEDNNPHE